MKNNRHQPREEKAVVPPDHSLLYLEPDPRFVAAHRREGWARDDAQLFHEWSLSRMEARTEAMLAFFGVPFQPHPVKLLDSLSGPLIEHLSKPEFRGERDMGVYIGNDHLYCVSFDLGLLVSRVMLRVVDPTFRLVVFRKRKTDVFYNHLTFVPTDDRWEGASWSPEYFAVGTCGGIINGKPDMSRLVEGVREILVKMV